MQMQSVFSWLYKLCKSTSTYSGGSGTEREKSQGEVRREFKVTQSIKTRMGRTRRIEKKKYTAPTESRC